MKIKVKILLVLSFASICALNAQYNGYGLGIAFNYSFTTTSRLYLFPKANDPFTRNQNVPIDDIFNFGIDIRYRISESVIAGLNIDYIKKTGATTDVIIVSNLGNLALEAEDGYTLIPVDFTFYYFLPFSTESMKFYMGGGAGFYFGSHVRKFLDIEAVNDSRKIGYGIHVAVGMDYMITEWFAVRGEMKFRDPEFEMTSTYSKLEFPIGENTFRIAHEKFDSKVNIDGATFTVGAVLNF